MEKLVILGAGTDLVRVARLEAAITRFGDRFLNRIFTPLEQACCAGRVNRAACFAKRFAAKEALVKALGTGMRDGIWFLDIEVRNDSQGRPGVSISGKTQALAHSLGVTNIHLSLSDEQEFALAFVVLER